MLATYPCFFDFYINVQTVVYCGTLASLLLFSSFGMSFNFHDFILSNKDMNNITIKKNEEQRS